MDFSDIKKGDTIRVNLVARSKAVGFSGKRVEVPAETMVVRFGSIGNVPGQPGRQRAECTVIVTAEGESLEEPALMYPDQAGHPVLGQQRYTDQRPTVTIYSDTAGQTFEKA